MVNKELNLQTLINLKATIERLIENSFKSIISNNAVLKKYKGQKADVVAEYAKLRKLYTQLQAIKMGIFNANKKKNSLGIPNQQAIVEKSDLERELSMLNSMFMQKTHNNNGKEEDAWEFIIPKSEIEERIIEIEERISKIKNALLNFNQTTLIKVKLDKDLNLIKI